MAPKQANKNTGALIMERRGCMAAEVRLQNTIPESPFSEIRQEAKTLRLILIHFLPIKTNAHFGATLLLTESKYQSD